jgi:hypothetical protein
MKQLPLKARDRLLFGAAMAGTALAWAVAPEAHISALGFIAIGVGFVGSALFLWLRPHA